MSNSINTQDRQSELEEIKHILGYCPGTSHQDCWYDKHSELEEGDLYDAQMQAIEAYITTRVKEAERLARVEAINKCHWYAGGYGSDANGFEVGYKCNCGFLAQNKSTIHGHVEWKIKELALTTTTNGKEE